MKYSVKIGNHRTSISVEPEFWHALQNIAQKRQISLNTLISEIDRTRTQSSLSSALRLYILRHYTAPHTTWGTPESEEQSKPKQDQG